MLLVGLAEEARDRGIGPEIVIQLIPYLVPKALMFAMPVSYTHLTLPTILLV